MTCLWHPWLLTVSLVASNLHSHLKESVTGNYLGLHTTSPDPTAPSFKCPSPLQAYCSILTVFASILWEAGLLLHTWAKGASHMVRAIVCKTETCSLQRFIKNLEDKNNKLCPQDITTVDNKDLHLYTLSHYG